MQQQAGFTLVEIAIVLVIIGLLLTGVMKGQEIITNAKAKNIENSFKQVSAAIYTYQDRYFALPGDDKKATRFGESIKTGNGNGKIEGDFDDSESQSNESNLIWLHLRNAGLIAGKKDDYTQPSNALGGIIGISNQNGVNIKGTFIGFSNIPGKVATIIEAHMDDGMTKSGSIRAEPTDDVYKDGEIYSLYFAM
jgi:prepilin-type N-terminal cleavage/methylation domain-containing protein